MAEGDGIAIRTYRLEVRGFDFDRIYVRASTPGRARYIAASAYSDAGFGTVGDGLRSIASTRLDPSADERRIVGHHGQAEGEGLLEWQHDDYPDRRSA